MLFVYGTLQEAHVQGAVLGRPVPVTALQRAIAPGYRTVTYPGRVYPALMASAAAAAPGLLLDDLSDLDIAVLDAFEGSEYRRAGIWVRVDGALQGADAYLPVLPVPAEAPAWSLADWIARHKPAVLRTETGTAKALRQRLSARASR